MRLKIDVRKYHRYVNTFVAELFESNAEAYNQDFGDSAIPRLRNSVAFVPLQEGLPLLSPWLNYGVGPGVREGNECV